MVKSKEQISKVSGEKTDNERLEGLDLDYMRKEIQKIIDNHLKGKPGWFSVENWGARSLLDFAGLSTGLITWEDLEKKYEQDKKDFNETYNEILNKYDYMMALDDLGRDTRDELSRLKADISLGKKLDIL